MTATVPSVDIKGTGARIDTLRKQAGMSVRDVQDILGLGCKNRHPSPICTQF